MTSRLVREAYRGRDGIGMMIVPHDEGFKVYRTVGGYDTIHGEAVAFGTTIHAARAAMKLLGDRLV